MLAGFIVDGREETANLDVTPLDLLACTADTEIPLDRLTNDWVGPRFIADVALCVAQETELFDKTVP